MPGDWTGDGIADPAVYRPSTHAWFALGLPTATWGLTGDALVPADYNGDGRLDRAVYRPSTGTWYVQGVDTIRYGEPGDVPVLDVALQRRGV